MQAIHLFIVAAAASLLLTVFTLSNAMADVPDASAPAIVAPMTSAPAVAPAIVAPAPAREDSAFVMNAAMDGMTEVELAELALDKSSNRSVRQFAKQIQTDHEKANAELGAVAKRRSIPVPGELDSDHETAIAALKLRNGPDFDAAYAKQMVAAHAGAIALFKQAAQSTDPDIAAFASRKLPTLQHHKEMADRLARGLAHA